MKRKLVLILVVVVAGIVFAGLVHLVLVAAHLSQSAPTTVQGLTSRRMWAGATLILSFLGVVVGGLAVARSSTRSAFPRAGAIFAALAGIIAAFNGGMVLAVADGGPGSGNGVVGGAAALVMGVVAVVLGAWAFYRMSRLTIGSH